jgi:hypothetical protein
VTNAIVAPPLCPIGSSRYSEEDKWFFYFAHLLNVGDKRTSYGYRSNFST